MNSIHPSAQLIGDVTLGTGNTIGPSVVIIGPVVIGDGNWFGTGTVIGAPPEVRSWEHPRDADAPSSGNGISIGSANILREYSQVHQGWHAQTSLGNDAFLMNQVYVAHDCQLEDGVTLASSVLLAGHVRVGARANIGMGTCVHQHRYVGNGAMVGMGSVVTRDLAPYSKSFGNPARVHGVNAIGMQRMGMSDLEIDAATVLYAGGFQPVDVLGLSGYEGLHESVECWRRYSIDSESR